MEMASLTKFEDSTALRGTGTLEDVAHVMKDMGAYVFLHCSLEMEKCYMRCYMQKPI